MTHTATTTYAPAPAFDQSRIEVLAYSFSPYTKSNASFTAHKVYLDILFLHPRTAETMTLRALAPAHLLCGTKERIETTVMREINSMLTFQSLGIA